MPHQDQGSIRDVAQPPKEQPKTGVQERQRFAQSVNKLTNQISTNLAATANMIERQLVTGDPELTKLGIPGAARGLRDIISGGTFIDQTGQAQGFLSAGPDSLRDAVRVADEIVQAAGSSGRQDIIGSATTIRNRLGEAFTKSLEREEAEASVKRVEQTDLELLRAQKARGEAEFKAAEERLKPFEAAGLQETKAAQAARESKVGAAEKISRATSQLKAMEKEFKFDSLPDNEFDKNNPGPGEVERTKIGQEASNETFQTLRQKLQQGAISGAEYDAAMLDIFRRAGLENPEGALIQWNLAMGVTAEDDTFNQKMLKIQQKIAQVQEKGFLERFMQVIAMIFGGQSSAMAFRLIQSERDAKVDLLQQQIELLKGDKEATREQRRFQSGVFSRLLQADRRRATGQSAESLDREVRARRDFFNRQVKALSDQLLETPEEDHASLVASSIPALEEAAKQMADASLLRGAQGRRATLEEVESTLESNLLPNIRRVLPAARAQIGR